MNEHLQRRLALRLGLLAALTSSLAVLFAFTDLQISIHYVDTTSAWARFLEKWGEVPFFVTAAVAGVLVLYYLYRAGTGKGATLSRNVVLFAAVTGVAAVVARLVLVPGLKYLWGRVRFRDLGPSMDSFTGWYVINGPSGDYSFPSGHTASVWLLLPLLYLVRDRLVPLRIATGIFAVGWAVAVSISRVRIGAHYASDVLFATAIDLAVLTVAAHLVEKRLSRGDSA